MPAPPKERKSLSALDDPARSPSELDLRRCLGTSADPWDDLVRRVGSAYLPSTAQWKFGGAKFGWSLRLKKADRIILYLIPREGFFLAGIVLGSAAVAAAQEADLPAPVVQSIAEARRYAEGTGLRLAINNAKDVDALMKLCELKMRARK
jgi:hypothetical protein